MVCLLFILLNTCTANIEVKPVYERVVCGIALDL